MMDRYQRQVMAMHIRRLGDGDKAQYIKHFAEAREVTVGEYQEYMDDSERKLDILRGLGPVGIPAGVGVDYVSGGPSPLLPSLLSAAVSPVAAPAAEVVGHLDMLNKAIINQMGIPSHLLGRSDK